MLSALLLACVAEVDDSGSPPRDSGYLADSVVDELLPVERDGDALVRGGQPFLFIGFNTRGILHYGDAAVLPASSSADIALTLDTVHDLGGTVIRVYVSHQAVDPAVAAERLATLLDEAERRHLYVIAVLTDAVDTGFCPPGDEDAYAQDVGPPALDGPWYDGGWREHYLPALQAAVTRNAGHPALFSWELGNEPGLAADPDALVAWVQDATAEIRSLDATSMVSAGLLSGSGAGLDTERAQQVYDLVDFATIHSYDETEITDIAALEETGMPLVAEAVGYSGDDRAAVVAYAATKLIGAGAEGYMQAGLMATEADNGDGDALIGMDRVYHQDWDALVATYEDLVSRL